MVNIHCPICGEKNKFKVRFSEKFEIESLEFVGRKTPDHMHFRVVQCVDCGLVYSNPIIPENKIMQLYRQSQFIEEPQLKNMVADYLGQFEKMQHFIHEKGRLLEIGCADGFFLNKIKKYGFKEVWGIEPSRGAYNNAPSFLQNRIKNTELKEGIFPGEYFDAVCFFQVFDHIVKPNQFLQIVYQYLKKGGILLAIHHDIKSFLPMVLRDKASTYDISHIHLWDKKTMRKILEKNGFEVCCIKNIANRYQLDHVMRMLPLPIFFKKLLRTFLKLTKLSNVSLKLSVENMISVARKK